MLTLAYPGWLVLIPLLLVLAWYAGRMRAPQDEGNVPLLLVHPNLAPLPQTPDLAPSGARWITRLNVLACALLILALARPQWVGDWIPAAPQGRDMVLLLDTSRTMSITDFQDAKQQPVERLTVLKGIVSRFVEARQGDRFGLIAFGTIAATLVPPTFDSRLLTGMIQRVQVGVAGNNTAIGDAIGLALKQLQERPRLRPALILFSDGADSNSGDLTPLEAVELARRAGVAIYTVQIGSDLFAAGRPKATAAPAEVQPGLQQIAQQTGGRYYLAANAAALQSVIDDIGKLERTVSRPSTQRMLLEWYWLPLLLAAALFSAGRFLQLRSQFA
jgi:Ca-activated chloride channel family protein